MSADPAPTDSLTASRECWPFQRWAPDCVVLGVRSGAKPTEAPPVRIFLGTEDAQYRAERVFFYSIEKFRDPGRVYEIYLMKSLQGFDQRHWRTGFTNYRYAIPDLAGGEGRAIYNDVDQIYLADPALMFDLDMGNHGYLAISARDTSVMLIDCARMRPMWNRERASTGSKYSLLNRPSRTPGLWGALDPHWNARDLEFAEGQTKCLHYTALHQQPWQPFPEHYSYHPNPLGYLWHDLEREADAAGYQVFHTDQPSPNFAECAALASEQESRPEIGESKESILWITLKAGVAAVDLPANWSLLDLASTDPGLPTEQFDTIVLSNILECIPPVDLDWLLEYAFRTSSKQVWLQTQTQAHRDLGSRRWWYDRIAIAAATFPEISWHLQVDDNDPMRADGGRFASTVRRLHRKPRVWIMDDGDGLQTGIAREIVKALNWPVETKLPSSAGTPGEPGLVISATPAHVKPAQAIKARSPETVRHVHIGQARHSLEHIDLVLATTGDRIPARPNTVHLTGLPIDHSKTAFDPAERDGWKQRLANFPRPMIAIWIDDDAARPSVGYEELGALARVARQRVEETGGSLLVHTGTGLSAQKSQEFEAALHGLVYHFEREQKAAGFVFAALADQAILLGLDDVTLIRLANSERPLTVVETHSPHHRSASGNPLRQIGHLIFGGGTTYRGTPHQQHWPARLVDSAIVKGWIKPSRNREALLRDLAARGLCIQGLQGEQVATARPLVDLKRAAEAIEHMMRRTDIRA
ncbi:MAG: ELM1/GtrOC1 family putative glycosyltransferase [Pseudomonadota bacterium]